MRNASAKSPRVTVRLIPEIAATLEAVRVRRGGKNTSSLINEAIIFRFRDFLGKRAMSNPKVKRILERVAA